MRLCSWVAVTVSVVLLLGAGAIALLVNRSALRAADTVHRADSTALGTNNATLAGSLQMLSAAEFDGFVTDHTLNLRPRDKADRAKLVAFVAKSTYFRYGVAVTDLTGTMLNATRATGLPASDDPGYTPMRHLLMAGKPGFSSVMVVDGVALEAVAVPITVGGAPAAVLVGFNDVAHTQLQQYTVSLNSAGHVTMIVDSTGRVGATSDPSTIGTRIDPAIIGTLSAAKGSTFVEYHAGRTLMTAFVVNGIMPGGWAYVRTQTEASFEGAVHNRSQTLNLTLLAMLLIGVIGISLLGYRSKIQRRRADERFQALFQHAPDMVAVLDVQGRISYASPSASVALGMKAGSMHGASVLDLVHAEDRPRMQEQFNALLGKRDSVLRLQCRVLDATGSFRWFEFTASNQMHNPALTGVVINARDVSENKAFEQRLEHEAQHDALTGLPNRRRMQDALDSTLRCRSVAVLFVDLDGFKPVNDAHGHEAGDELLRQVAERLSLCVRQEDVLARVGVHLADSATDSDAALRAADHAMYTVKRSGGGRRAGAGTAVVRVGRHRADA